MTSKKGRRRRGTRSALRGIVATSAAMQAFPFYPFLFIAFPVIAYVGNNINEMEASLLWRPLIVLLISLGVILTLLYLIMKSWHRAALAASNLILLFFTYGHAYLYLKSVEVAGFILGRHRLLVPLWFASAAIGIWWLAFKNTKPERYTSVLNVISVFLLVFPSFQIISYTAQREQALRLTQEAHQESGATLPLGYAPDIYYIILDAYGRQDVLEEMFNYDNSSFLDDLRSMGFYVADCSQSNYSWTMLSLASSLNFNYLDQITDKLTKDTETFAPLRALGQNNVVRTFLHQQGYSVVAFATSFPVSEWTDADYFLTPPPQGMNDFELAFAQTTLWRVPMDFTDEPLEKRSTEWFRRRTLSALDHLENTIPNLPSPKFILAHLVIPHHPFVFNATGGEPSSEISDPINVTSIDIYKKGYPDQVTYINSRIEKVIHRIFETSSRPPIIIIQGDHGPAPFDVIERRMKILNAYFFPDNDYEGLYASISPVNTFRVILDKYFSQNYPLLPDISYYSTYDRPYDYLEVPNLCR